MTTETTTGFRPEDMHDELFWSIKDFPVCKIQVAIGDCGTVYKIEPSGKEALPVSITIKAPDNPTPMIVLARSISEAEDMAEDYNWDRRVRLFFSDGLLMGILTLGGGK